MSSISPRRLRRPRAANHVPGFNWVVLLNVFNLIIPGTVVDVLTGAWLNLDDKVEIRLREQPRS